MDDKLKGLRVVVSLIFILVTTLLFINIWNSSNENFSKTVLFFQFTPSLLTFIRTLSIFSTGFILIIAFALLIGRAYCSFICPLGVMQDIFSYISRKIGIKKNYKYRKGYPALRYSILSIVFVLFMFNFITALSFLDPYSIFGRIMNNFGVPVISLFNNGVAEVFNKLGIYSVYRIDVPFQSAASITLSSLVFLTIIIMSVFRGRLWCNTMCPVGTLLGLFSKRALYKIIFYTEKCTRCGKCSTVCKSECILIKEQTLDFSRCVDCFNCIDICPEDAIGFDRTKKTPLPLTIEPDKTKREFVSQTALWLIGLFSFKSILGLKAENEDEGYKCRSQMNTVSPPGAISTERFNYTCTACHLCVSACPTKVLKPSLLEYGLKGMLQPYMDYKDSFCNYDCTVCSEICPTGAILPIDVLEKHQTQIGKVVFYPRHCIVITDGTACGSCAEHCPTQAVTMVPYNDRGLTIPEVKPEICIGCGACEYACPVIGKAILVDGHNVHQSASLPDSEKDQKNDEEIEEFPF